MLKITFFLSHVFLQQDKCSLKALLKFNTNQFHQKLQNLSQSTNYNGIIIALLLNQIHLMAGSVQSNY